MVNNFPYTIDNKRYHILTYFYQHKFGCKIAKVSLNANFSCPNIDGTKSYGGCIFCSKSGSGDFAGDVNDSLMMQFIKGKKMMQKKWPNAKFIAYFQARTNTYADVDTLKRYFEPFINNKDCVGLAIATRSDSISNSCLDYLESISKRCYLQVELGLQSSKKETLKLINRGETVEEFETMVNKLRDRNINVVVHIINGLPYETDNDMLDTVKYLNKLDIQGIKIHMLHILKDTPLEIMYKNHPFKVLTKDEYVNITVKQLTYLRKEIVIHRITGDPKKEDLIEPTWLLKKFEVLNEIDKKMVKDNIYQGDNV